MQYLIDVGNTRVKYTKNHTPLSVQYTEHNELEQLFSVIKHDDIHHIVMTAGRSDSSQQAQKNITAFADAQDIPTHIVAIDNQLLRVNYTDPQQFGIDRYLNLLGARQQLTENFCVVSCGTAITLDFYTTEHIGGMISLGLGASRQVLKEKTGLTEIEKPSDTLGNSTATTIGSGLYFGYENLIYGSIHAIEKKLNLSLQVIFTGGDAEVLSKGDNISPNLLFQGMHIYVTKDS